NDINFFSQLCIAMTVRIFGAKVATLNSAVT
ncbi:MAG: hypothetical protein ACI9W7_000730, partial [Porticoccaceae bacterium]